jgi:hypothetical protein
MTAVVVTSPEKLVSVEDNRVRVIAVGGQGPSGPPGVGQPIPLVAWYWRGDLAVATGTALVPIYGDWTVVAITAKAGTAPLGQDAIFDVRDDAGSLWAPADRLTIPAGSTDGAHGVFADATIEDGSILRNDTIQAGLGTAGANVSVVVWALPA